jgi:hypothetical protein
MRAHPPQWYVTMQVTVRTLSLGTVLMVQDRAPLLLDVELLAVGAAKPAKDSAKAAAAAAGMEGAASRESASSAPPPSSSFMAMSLSAMAPKAEGALGKAEAAAAGVGNVATAATRAPAAQVGVPPGMQWAAKSTSSGKKKESCPPPAPPPAAWGGFRGVVGYQAPELEAGGEPSPLSDLWAVGMMMFHTVFPNAPAVPDAASGGVVVPPHEDESLRALLTSLLRTAPESRLQSADHALAHPFLATDLMGRAAGAEEPLVQTEWKVKLLRQYGQRLQAGRKPLRIEVSLTHLVDSTLTAFASIHKGNLVQPLHVMFVNANAVQPLERMPTVASLYTTFFTQVGDRALCEQRRVYQSWMT